MFGDLSALLGQPMSVSFGSPQISPSLSASGPTLGQYANSLPQFQPSFGQMLGGALRGLPQQNPNAGLSPTGPQLAPMRGSGLLQSILADQTPTSGGMGLHEILMRLGAIRQ